MRLAVSKKKADLNTLMLFKGYNRDYADKLLIKYLERCKLLHKLAFAQFRAKLPNAKINDIKDMFESLKSRFRSHYKDLKECLIAEANPHKRRIRRGLTKSSSSMSKSKFESFKMSKGALLMTGIENIEDMDEEVGTELLLGPEPNWELKGFEGVAIKMLMD